MAQWRKPLSFGCNFSQPTPKVLKRWQPKQSFANSSTSPTFLVASFGLQILTIHHSLLAIRYSLPFSRKAIGATSAQTDGDFRVIVATLDATTIVAGRTNARHNFRERVSAVEAFPFVTGTANPCHPISKGSPTQNALCRCHPSSPPALIVFHRVCSGRTAVRPYYMADTVVCPYHSPLTTPAISSPLSGYNQASNPQAL